MYFEPLISVKCCPKLHIKQLRNKFTLHLSVRLGWVGEGVTDIKRWVQEKGGGQDPLTPPSGHAYDSHKYACITQHSTKTSILVLKRSAVKVCKNAFPHDNSSLCWLIVSELLV